MTKKRAYCKNTVQGSQRGRKYPPTPRADVVMAMVASNSVCAVARRYKVPESTIRSWLAEEAAKGDAFAEARQAAAREIAVRASIGAKEQVAYLQGRVAESQRAAEIRAKLDKRLEEGVRAGAAEVGAKLKTEQEALADAAEVGLVGYNSPGSYDRKLLDNDRRQLEALREHYDGLTMDDKNAANVARVLMDVAEKAAALAAKREELKAFVERMRAALHMKVSLIGNDKKGRIYIDYFSAEELYRFMHVLDVIESEDFD